MGSERENTAFSKGFMQAMGEQAAIFDAIYKCHIGQETNVSLTLFSGVVVTVERPSIIPAQPADLPRNSG